MPILAPDQDILTLPYHVDIHRYNNKQSRDKYMHSHLPESSQFKLIVSDVDETLLNSKMVLEDFTVDVLRELKRNNIGITFATGRSYKSVTSLIDILEIKMPMVFANGAMIQDHDGKVLLSKTLKNELMIEIIKVCNHFNADWMICYEKEILVREINNNTGITSEYNEPDPIRISDKVENLKKLNEPTKLIVVDRENPQKLRIVLDMLKEKMGDELNISFSLDIFLEIMPAGVSKLSGVKFVADSLGIDKNQIIAFGDGDNDAEMLGYVGLGIAVENASPKCKSYAKLVVGHHNEQGPANFLNQFYNLGIKNQ